MEWRPISARRGLSSLEKYACILSSSDIEIIRMNNGFFCSFPYHLCGLVVRVPGYWFRGRCSIPGATRFSEKWCVWNGVRSASWVQLRSCLEEIHVIAALVWKTKNTAARLRYADHATPLCPQKLELTSPKAAVVRYNFARGLRPRSSGF
jgi:hypothetical protein